MRRAGPEGNANDCMSDPMRPFAQRFLEPDPGNDVTIGTAAAIDKTENREIELSSRSLLWAMARQRFKKKAEPPKGVGPSQGK